MNSLRYLFVAFCSLLLAHTAQAQFEIQLDPTNVLDPRCAGAAVTGITSGRIDATKITITSPGGSYSAPPVVVIGPPASGTTARVTATISGGMVTGFIIVDGGTGYSAGNLPTIRIAPPTILVLGNTTGTPNSGWSSTSGSSAAYRAAVVDNVQPELASYLPNNLVKRAHGLQQRLSPPPSSWRLPVSAIASVPRPRFTSSAMSSRPPPWTGMMCRWMSRRPTTGEPIPWSLARPSRERPPPQ